MNWNKGGEPVENESKKEIMFKRMKKKKKEVKIVRKIVSIIVLSCIIDCRNWWLLLRIVM